jgi:MHS family proline/betaine transporter-like MFS transporter
MVRRPCSGRPNCGTGSWPASSATSSSGTTSRSTAISPASSRPLFFPSQNPAAGLIATYGVFAAGFLMRPLGAAFFGWFGDRYGRARTMQISVTMMALPTVLLGLLPTYAQVGLLAPVLLVVLRLLQGVSVGGEFSSSATYLVETAPLATAGTDGKLGQYRVDVGFASGRWCGGAGDECVRCRQIVSDWAWRLPFLFGAVLGGTAI